MGQLNPHMSAASGQPQIVVPSQAMQQSGTANAHKGKDPSLLADMLKSTTVTPRKRKPKTQAVGEGASKRQKKNSGAVHDAQGTSQQAEHMAGSVGSCLSPSTGATSSPSNSPNTGDGTRDVDSGAASGSASDTTTMSHDAKQSPNSGSRLAGYPGTPNGCLNPNQICLPPQNVQSPSKLASEQRLGPPNRDLPTTSMAPPPASKSEPLVERDQDSSVKSLRDDLADLGSPYRCTFDDLQDPLPELIEPTFGMGDDLMDDLNFGCDDLLDTDNLGSQDLFGSEL